MRPCAASGAGVGSWVLSFCRDGGSHEPWTARYELERRFLDLARAIDRGGGRCADGARSQGDVCLDLGAALGAQVSLGELLERRTDYRGFAEGAGSHAPFPGT